MALTRIDTAEVDEARLQDFLEQIEYRVARSKEELEKAYALVYKEYLKRGYVKESDARLKLSLHNALPQTTSFVTVFEQEIFSTATLIPDSPLGLPMDEIYHQELEQLRKQGKKACEISMLASDTELFKNGISLLLNSKKMFFIFNLFKLIFDYAYRHLALDCICITINPKHILTYEFLLFKDLGGLKFYDNANGAPAIAKYIEFNSLEEECKQKNKEGLYKMFLQKATPLENFSQKAAFSPEDLGYFFSKKTRIFKNASSFQLDYIKQCYPAYNFTDIIT